MKKKKLQKHLKKFREKQAQAKKTYVIHYSEIVRYLGEEVEARNQDEALQKFIQLLKANQVQAASYERFNTEITLLHADGAELQKPHHDLPRG